MKINNPIYIINKHAQKEFNNFKDFDKRHQSYVSLQNQIISCLKENPRNLKENILDTEQEILYLQLNNFDNFMGLRYGMWAFSLAIMCVVFDNNTIFKISNTFIEYFTRFILFFAVISIIALNSRSNYQKERIIYLNFKLKCFDKLKNIKYEPKTDYIEVYKI